MAPTHTQADPFEVVVSGGPPPGALDWQGLYERIGRLKCDLRAALSAEPLRSADELLEAGCLADAALMDFWQAHGTRLAGDDALLREFFGAFQVRHAAYQQSRQAVLRARAERAAAQLERPELLAVSAEIGRLTARLTLLQHKLPGDSASAELLDDIEPLLALGPLLDRIRALHEDLLDLRIRWLSLRKSSC